MLVLIVGNVVKASVEANTKAKQNNNNLPSRYLVQQPDHRGVKHMSNLPRKQQRNKPKYPLLRLSWQFYDYKKVFPELSHTDFAILTVVWDAGTERWINQSTIAKLTLLNIKTVNRRIKVMCSLVYKGLPFITSVYDPERHTTSWSFEGLLLLADDVYRGKTQSPRGYDTESQGVGQANTECDETTGEIATTTNKQLINNSSSPKEIEFKSRQDPTLLDNSFKLQASDKQKAFVRKHRATLSEMEQMLLDEDLKGFAARKDQAGHDLWLNQLISRVTAGWKQGELK